MGKIEKSEGHKINPNGNKTPIKMKTIPFNIDRLKHKSPIVLEEFKDRMMKSPIDVIYSKIVNLLNECYETWSDKDIYKFLKEKREHLGTATEYQCGQIDLIDLILKEFFNE